MPVFAGEIRKAEVDYSGGAYYLDFDAVINSRFEVVHSIVTDYEHLHELSSAVLESAVLDSSDPGAKRLRFFAQVCLLVFCFNKYLVVDIVEVSRGVFNATVVPQLCDFKAGHGTWHFTAVGKVRTRVRYTGVQRPAFWIPPVIGPYLIKRKLVREAIETIQQVEVLTGDA